MYFKCDSVEDMTCARCPWRFISRASVNIDTDRGEVPRCISRYDTQMVRECCNLHGVGLQGNVLLSQRTVLHHDVFLMGATYTKSGR